jgi:hypothetical protein
VRIAATLATLAATAAVLPFAMHTSAESLARVDGCVISDGRAVELSGLVVTTTGYVAVNDGQDDPSRMQIFYLDTACAVTKTLSYPTTARDPEDVAVGPDGALWVADIGDNLTSQTRRDSVALWRVPANADTPVIHRMTYPDGPHDAEALLFAGDGSPIVVTKEVNGVAGLYQPTGPLQPQAAAGVPMRRVGQFTATFIGTENLLGRTGEVMVTGAATSADRRRVALRTYTAAYEWDVPDGDVVKAITTTKPRFTSLTEEPQGEAITYSADGASFVTLSDEQVPTTLRTWVPSHGPVPPSAPSSPISAGPIAAAPPTGLASVPVWLSVVVGVGGIALVAVGAFGLRRGRHQATATPPPA